LKFTAFELGGFWNLAGTPLELFKSFQISPWLVGEEEQGCRRPNSSEGRRRGGEGLAHEHQELRARPGVGLGGRGGDRRRGSHGGRDGGEDELIGKGLPRQEEGKLSGWSDWTEKGRR
jgi:hypothetical protein